MAREGRDWVIVGMAWLMVLPGAAAAPVDVTVEPDLGPWVDYLAPVVQAGGISIEDGVITLTVQTLEVVAPSGAVKVRVPWSFLQEAGQPYGYYRSAYAQVYVEEDGVTLAHDYVDRQWYQAYWDEDGAFELDVTLNGVEARHELFVRLYAQYYNSYPYSNQNREAVSAVVATGVPPLVTERVTTAPVLRGPQVQALDARAADFAPNLDLRVDFDTVDTTVTPDRFVIFSIPYQFERTATRQHRGWGYEYGYVQFNAYDQDGNYLGGSGSSWYLERQCCNALLETDIEGTLTAPLTFNYGSDARREIFVDVYFYWQGYACDPSINCSWFGEGHSDYGFAGLVYTLPANPPPMTPEGLAQEVLDLV